MGVDFRMQVVRPVPEGRFEPISGEETPMSSQDTVLRGRGLMWGSTGLEFWSRLLFLEALFRPGHAEDSPAELFRSRVPPNASFRWFEQCYQGGYRDLPPPTVRDCFRPREVVECLGAALDVLGDRETAIPPLYVLREEGMGDWRAGFQGVFEGRVYSIRAGWGRCDATPTVPDPRVPYPEGDRTIDLRGTPTIRCRVIGLGGIAPGRVGSTLGPEMTFRIESQSGLDVYGPPLKAMKTVASRADAAGGLVFTLLS